MQKLIELIQNEQYQEAFNGFLELYQKTHSIEALYYMTILEYIYLNEKDYDRIVDGFRQLMNSPKKYRVGSYEPFLSLLLDYEFFDECHDIALKALNDSVDSFIVKYAYAKGLWHHKNKIDEALKTIEKTLGDENMSPEMIFATNELIIELYQSKKDLTKSRELLNRLYLISQNNDAISMLEFKQALAEDNEELVLKNANKVLQINEYKGKANNLLADYYYDKKEYSKAISYYETLKSYLNYPYNAERRIILCYMFQNKYEEALKILFTLDQNNPDVLYLIAECYYNNPYSIPADYKKAAEYYFKGFELCKHTDLLKGYADACDECNDIEGFTKAVDMLQKINKKDEYLPYLKTKLYLATQKFDKAQKEVFFLMKKKGSNSYRLMNYGYQSFSNPKLTYKYYQELIKKDEPEPLRVRAKTYLYGLYDLNPDMNKAEETVKLLEKTENDNCRFSVIGAFYLKKHNYEKAFEIFKNAHDRYVNRLDTCQCSSGFLAYCYLKGLGVEQNVEEALKICQMIREKEFDSVCENVGNIYAECCIILNKNQEDAYNLLIKTIERRFPISRLFMIIKLGKLLNKNVKLYEKLFSQALKFCSKTEYEYYKNPQKDFLMNNY